MTFNDGDLLYAEQLNQLNTGIESGAYRLLSNMRSGKLDCTVICNSDSTGITGDYDGATFYNKFLFKLAKWLGEQYPIYTVRYYDVVPGFYNAVQTLQQGNKKISAASIYAGGSGYVVGDAVYLNNGITLSVTSVSSGSVTAVSIGGPGSVSSSSIPANPVPQQSTTGTGTGAQFNLTWVNGPILYFYNAAFAGTQATYLMGTRFQAVFNPRSNADLIIFNHGHNTDGNASANTQSGMSLAAIYTILGYHPSAGVIIVSQNPIRDNDSGTNRSIGARQAGVAGGFSVLDVHQLYLDAGKPKEWYRIIPATGLYDTIHPGSLGDSKIFDAIKELFTWPIKPKAINQGLQFRQNLLLNGDFSTWSNISNPPDSWVSSAITLTKNTTTGMFESGSWSLNATSTSTSESYIEQALPASLVRMLVGKVVTLSIRCYVAAANTSSTCARMRIVEIDNTTPYGIPSGGRDGFIWKSVVVTIPVTATTLTIRVMADSAGVSAGSSCIFDRVVLSAGSIPMDSY